MPDFSPKTKPTKVGWGHRFIYTTNITTWTISWYRAYVISWLYKETTTGFTSQLAGCQRRGVTELYCYADHDYITESVGNICVRFTYKYIFHSVV